MVRWIYPHLTHPRLKPNNRNNCEAPTSHQQFASTRARVDTGSLPNAIFEETFVDIAIRIVGRSFSWSESMPISPRN